MPEPGEAPRGPAYRAGRALGSALFWVGLGAAVAAGLGCFAAVAHSAYLWAMAALGG